MASMYVSVTGFRDKRWNKRRIAHALQVMQAMTELGVELVVFPAGYVTAETEADTADLLEPLFEYACRKSLGFVLGVDLASACDMADNKENVDTHLQNHSLPCLQYAYCPDTQSSQVWRQRSCTSLQARNLVASKWLIEAPRFITVKGHRIELVLCGEIYDERLGEAIEKRKPELCVVTGHKGMPRFFRTLQRLTPLKLNLLLSEHRYNVNGLHCYSNGGVYSDRWDGIMLKGESLWSELWLWELRKRKLRSCRSLRNPG
jgi:hypothetical protein